MPDKTDMALSNRQTITDGNDPHTHVSDRVQQLQDEVDRLFREHEMPDGLCRSQVNCYVADWRSKIGNCRYNKCIDPGEYGQRVSGVKRSQGTYSIGVAKRAFDSKDTWVDTIRHELAHVTAYVTSGYNCNGHGDLWRAEADRLGADPTRTDRVSPENQVEANYFLGCPNGCFRNGKQVRSKRIKHPDWYRCPECEAKCVSWVQGDPRPSEGGTCAVDLS